jgi:hypothetical protein
MGFKSKNLMVTAASLIAVIIGGFYFYITGNVGSQPQELPSATPVTLKTHANVAEGTPTAEVSPKHPVDNPDFPNFPTGELSPEIPHDVDILFQNYLDDSNNAADSQRLFDIFSWQAFIAVNWPADGKVQVTENITQPVTPQWATWKVSTEVFKEDGSNPEEPAETATPGSNPEDDSCQGIKSQLFNFDASSTDRSNILDTITQADAKVLWDQNGNPVYYEVLMNELEYNYIISNTLYNLDGQIAFLENHSQVYLPQGAFLNNLGKPFNKNPEQVGAMELKLAWKVMAPGDIQSRFYTKPACLLNLDGTWEIKDVGLVGIHIAHKTQSSKNWIWSTFEQVDNVQVDAQEVATYTPQNKVLKPSFNDPACNDCQPNTIKAQNGLTKTQVVRLNPLLDGTAQLNAQVQQRLKGIGSVWQYYELIATQWPPDPQQVTPSPQFLANSTMETYVQENSSCMNCHYSAAMAKSGDPETDKIEWSDPGVADFTFLLAKAHWKK